MIEFIVQLLITPVILLIAAKWMDGVHIENTKAAIYTSVSIIVVGFLVGWLLTLILNIATLGIFWIIGLGIVTRTIAYAIIIEIIDQFRKDFNTRGFLPSLWLSIILAVSWGVVDIIF
ncbi:MAG: phage holin family protein [Cyclobacteriaceae bacterium]|nr:phage holin family protein [Cyclobacteriaceae bacterium]